MVVGRLRNPNRCHICERRIRPGANSIWRSHPGIIARPSSRAGARRGAGRTIEEEPMTSVASTSVASRWSAIVAIICLGSLLSGCGYNTIPSLEEQAKARWSDVQNQYQRRADLIPNLVATVQGYAAQEKNVLTAVVEARAKATQITVNSSDLTDPDKLKAFQDAQAQLTGALGRLLAVSENYPDL